MILEEDDSGTINVAIRIRPLSNSEKERGDVAAWNVSEDRDKIIASDPQDRDEFFDPSDDKIYRHPNFYNIPDDVGHM